MKLASVKTPDGDAAALVLGERVLALGEVNRHFGTRWATSLFELLERGQLAPLQDWYASERAALAAHPQSQAEAQVSYAPLYRRPRKLLGVGLNYVEHAGDLGETSPTEPASFMKPDTTIIGPDDPIELPRQSERTTGEAELGVVIGRRAKDLSEAEAPSAVAGFTTLVDMTAEDILQRNPRFLTRAKSFDTFFSFGPHLVTPDEVGDLAALEVATVLNGRVHRQNQVRNMMFSPYFLVAFFSQVMTLLPGDIISTGTPGAAVLQHGDTVACEIPGIGRLSNPVIDLKRGEAR